VRVTKAVTGRAAAGTGKGRQVQKYSGPGDGDSARREGRYIWF